jgi:hypothetical protein
MPRDDDVRRQVAGSIERAEAAALGVRTVLARLDESLAQLQLTTVDSVHPNAAQALVRMEAARHRLLDAEALMRSAISAAHQYRTVL